MSSMPAATQISPQPRRISDSGRADASLINTITAMRAVQDKKVTVVTRNEDHAQALIGALEESGYPVERQR